LSGERVHDTLHTGLAVAYRPADAWVLRGRFAYDETPVPNTIRRTPRIPDHDRYWLSIGAALQLAETVVVDVGYAHVFSQNAQIENRDPLNCREDPCRRSPRNRPTRRGAAGECAHASGSRNARRWRVFEDARDRCAWHGPCDDLGMDTRRRPGIPLDPDHSDPDMELCLRLEPIVPDPMASTAREPSRRTSLAVLADAISTFRRTAAPITPDEEHGFVETVRWFASNDETDPLGFLAVCRVLAIDPALLRAGLKSVRARALGARRDRVLH
jgi:hypothetical protein